MQQLLSVHGTLDPGERAASAMEEPKTEATAPAMAARMTARRDALRPTSLVRSSKRRSSIFFLSRSAADHDGARQYDGVAAVKHVSPTGHGHAGSPKAMQSWLPLMVTRSPPAPFWRQKVCGTGVPGGTTRKQPPLRHTYPLGQPKSFAQAQLRDVLQN